MTVFDAPTRETACMARSRTSSPLQALVLMNDPTYVEAARQLAEGMLGEVHGDATARSARGFQKVLCREPTADENAELVGLYQRQLVRFQDNPEAAGELLKVGESPTDLRWPAPERAAWTVVAQVLLCLDEAITRN
jgi:hypothetical protein